MMGYRDSLRDSSTGQVTRGTLAALSLEQLDYSTSKSSGDKTYNDLDSGGKCRTTDSGRTGQRRVPHI